jgi:hypothetical protein
MKAICILCGQHVTSKHMPGLLPAETEELLTYDSLSAQMWLHISNSHPSQMQEGILNQQRAAKMYAMNWATAPELDELQRRYRAGLLIRMTITTEFKGIRQAEAAAPGAEPDADPSGDASKSKKSSRNASN